MDSIIMSYANYVKYMELLSGISSLEWGLPNSEDAFYVNCEIE